MRRVPFRRRTGEPVIALVNVVFLLLVFFLIAGTLTPPAAPDLVTSEALAAAPPPDALVLHADGSLSHRAAPADPAGFVAATGPVARLMPAREADAARLVEVAAALRDAGAARVLVVGQRPAPR